MAPEGDSMKTIGLSSPETSQPIMLSHGVMTYDKKVRFGGWNHPDYKYVRRMLDRFWRSEFEEELIQKNHWLVCRVGDASKRKCNSAAEA